MRVCVRMCKLVYVRLSEFGLCMCRIKLEEVDL
jgi:hypothetical protein